MRRLVAGLLVLLLGLAVSVPALGWSWGSYEDTVLALRDVLPGYLNENGYPAELKIDKAETLAWLFAELERHVAAVYEYEAGPPEGLPCVHCPGLSPCAHSEWDAAMWTMSRQFEYERSVAFAAQWAAILAHAESRLDPMQKALDEAMASLPPVVPGAPASPSPETPAMTVVPLGQTIVAHGLEFTVQSVVYGAHECWGRLTPEGSVTVSYHIVNRSDKAVSGVRLTFALENSLYDAEFNSQGYERRGERVDRWIYPGEVCTWCHVYYCRGWSDVSIATITVQCYLRSLVDGSSTTVTIGHWEVAE